MKNQSDEMTNIQYKAINNRYNAVDGLRVYSALGIVFMHVLANSNYGLNGFMFEKFIPSLTNLVYLFMIISGFSMCCGYYHKILLGNISIIEFYKKRYEKILPYFAFLCFLEFMISPTINSVVCVFLNVTLCFGLLPSYNMTIIGVGWFLGLIFVFYMLFPFYCYLLSSKKKAWISFFLALVLNYLCVYKFKVGRVNIIHSGVYFILGGLIYLYRDFIGKFISKFRFILCLLIFIFGFIYYTISDTTIIMLFMYGLVLIYALDTKCENYLFLNNGFVMRLSNISLEIYLSHMVIYRLIEKLNLLNLFDFELASYLFTAIVTILGTIVFSLIVRFIISSFMARCVKANSIIRK